MHMFMYDVCSIVEIGWCDRAVNANEFLFCVQSTNILLHRLYVQRFAVTRGGWEATLLQVQTSDGVTYVLMSASQNFFFSVSRCFIAASSC
jgi:hypothetical protein